MQGNNGAESKRTAARRAAARRGAMLLCVVGVVVVGCSGRSVDDRSNDLMLDASGVGRVESEGGVHIFVHTFESFDLAGLSGVPTIDDRSCLRLGDYVVVWYAGLLDEAKELAAAALAGDTSEYSTSGGVGPAPARVREACGVNESWGSGPEIVRGARLPGSNEETP